MYLYGYSRILYDDNAPQRVAGIAGTELYFFGYPDLYNEDFDPWVHSSLSRTDPPFDESPLSEGTLTGFRDLYPAAGYHSTFYAASGRTYCVNSDHARIHYVRIYGNVWTSTRRIVGRTQDCHSFPILSTPTPTPLITPSPTPTPSPLPTPTPCEPSALACNNQYTVQAYTSVTNLKPAGVAGGGNTARISVCIIPAQANLPASLRLLRTPQNVNAGGHVDSLHLGQRPLGKLAKTSGTTGSNGCFSTTYSPSHISGLVGIDGTISGTTSCCLNLGVKVDGLFDLGTGQNYSLIGQTSSHPVNHFGYGVTNIGLRQIADDYKSFYYGNNPFPNNDHKIAYNDMSLEWGGKFDLYKGWENTNDHHGEHRDGINCDTRSNNIPGKRWAKLNQFFIDRGSTNTKDETATIAPHWHLRFLFGATSAAAERTPHMFVEDGFGSALGREANQNEYETWLVRITNAKVQGQSQLFSEAKGFHKAHFGSEEYSLRNRFNEDFIKDVFWAYLFREPTATELQFWLNHLISITPPVPMPDEELRISFLNDFENIPEFQEVLSEIVDPVPASTQ